MNGSTTSDCNINSTCNENSITNVISTVGDIFKIISTVSEIANEAISAVIRFNCAGC